MDRLRLESWVTQFNRLKFRWAGRVAQKREDKWAFHALMWKPQLTTTRAQRPPGHPRKRWDEGIDAWMKRACGHD
eukprot:1666692-Karenia_brevis.AAC.1